MSKLSEALQHVAKHGGHYTFSVEETAEIHREFAAQFPDSIEEIRQRERARQAFNPHSIIVG